MERRWAESEDSWIAIRSSFCKMSTSYYLTGTVQTGVLWFPREGEPLFAVRKSFERAKMESAVRNLVPSEDVFRIAGSDSESRRDSWASNWMSFPLATYQQVSKYFPGVEDRGRLHGRAQCARGENAV